MELQPGSLLLAIVVSAWHTALGLWAFHVMQDQVLVHTSYSSSELRVPL